MFIYLFFVVYLHCLWMFQVCNQYIISYNQEPPWLWSYGSWIYIHLCKQCLSPLILWADTSLSPGVLNTTLCDNVCQWLATGQWFSSGVLVSSTNKTDRHDITEILLQVALSTIKPTNQPNLLIRECFKNVICMHTDHLSICSRSSFHVLYDK